MKIKKLSIILATTACAAMLFSGCGTDQTASSSSQESSVTQETDSSAASESAQNTTASINTRWYDTKNSPLVNATVTITDSSSKQLYTGTTDNNGALGAFTIPVGSSVTVTVKNSNGTQIGSSKITCKSTDAAQITVHPIESNSQLIDLPSDDTNLSAAMFVTSNEKVEMDSVSRNRS